MILPSAVYYDYEQFGFYKPRVHFGEPITPGVSDSVSVLTNQLRHNLQEALNTIIKR